MNPVYQQGKISGIRRENLYRRKSMVQLTLRIDLPLGDFALAFCIVDDMIAVNHSLHDVYYEYISIDEFRRCVFVRFHYKFGSRPTQAIEEYIDDINTAFATWVPLTGSLGDMAENVKHVPAGSHIFDSVIVLASDRLERNINMDNMSFNFASDVVSQEIDDALASGESLDTDHFWDLLDTILDQDDDQ